MLDILWRENKPAPIQFANQQMSRRQSRDLSEVGFTQMACPSNDIPILARIAVSFGSNLKRSRIGSLHPWRRSRWPCHGGWLRRARNGYGGFSARQRRRFRDPPLKWRGLGQPGFGEFQRRRRFWRTRDRRGRFATPRPGGPKLGNRGGWAA